MNTKAPISLAPRWEWRTFAPDLSALRGKLHSLDGATAKYSRETYIVCDSPRYNTKIRFEVLDVKRLIEVDPNGLQLWNPVFKETFPIRAEMLGKLFGVIGNKPPVFALHAYSLPEFLDQVALPEHGMRVVHVEKSRRGFEFADCTAEFADVTINGQPAQSFCLEHTDPAKVVRALEDLDLRGAPNVSYPAAIKAAIGWASLTAA